MGYVQVDQGVVTHRKTLRLARLLGETRYAVVGRLVALWSWSLDSAISGELRDVDGDILADVMGWDGKPAELFEALMTVGFLDLDADGALRLHNWDVRMGPLIQRRADQAAASARYRERQKVKLAGSAQSLLQHQPDVDDGDAGEGSHVTRTSSSRHDDVMRKSRVEKSSVEYTGFVEGERERAREAHETPWGADAPALASALSAAPSPAVVSGSGRLDAPDARDQYAADAAAAAQPRHAAAPTLAATRSTPARSAPPAPPAPPATEVAERADVAEGANGVAAKPVRKPDVLWDACVAAMGRCPSNDVERGLWNKGLKSLRQSDATPEEIAARCARYRERFGPDIPLHPMALAKNWTQLTPGTEVYPYATISATATAQGAHISGISGQSAAALRGSPVHGVRSSPAGATGGTGGTGGYGDRLSYAGSRRAGARAHGGNAIAPELIIGTPEYYDAFERRRAARANG